MRISGRLTLLLVIPLVALLGITGYGVAYGATRSGEASRLQEQTELGLLAHEVAADLQTERARLVSEGTVDAELRARIEASGERLVARANQIGGPLTGPASVVAQRLTAVQRIANAGLGGQVALRNYAIAVNSTLDFADQAVDPAGAIDDAESSTISYLARARAASSEEHDLLIDLASGRSLDAAAFQQLTALASAQERYAELATASSSAAPDLRIRIERIGHEMRAADVTRRAAFATFGTETNQEWLDGLNERTQELSVLQSDASVFAVDAVNDLARSSRILLLTAALSAVAILLVSAYLLHRAVRTIVRPLQDLASQAEDVARTRLPEAVKTQQSHGSEELHLPAIRATGAAEVHEVAAAFNDVQDTALRLAGEQAALRVNQAEAMTNLGRRNQTLLARQLDFISSLETRETDPVFLEHLFKLDHLASRMRRNAESLLILAGSETPRRRRTPAPVTEVVRAAMSEVEEFERVRIGALRDATVSGPAVIDLVHLLAELIENALGFSPPDSTVEIDGRSLGQGGYQFAVIDHGVGMSELELIAANQRISGDDELEGMPTRYLGQYVVAKLAKKLGAMVRLQRSHGGKGVTAVVNLPDDAMHGTPDRSAVARPLPGSRAAREQGPVPFAPGAGVSESARSTAPAESWSEHLDPVEASASAPAFDATATPDVEASFWDTALEPVTEDGPALQADGGIEAPAAVPELDLTDRGGFFAADAVDTVEAPTFEPVDTSVSDAEPESSSATPADDSYPVEHIDAEPVEAPSFEAPQFEDPPFEAPQFEDPPFGTSPFDAGADAVDVDAVDEQTPSFETPSLETQDLDVADFAAEDFDVVGLTDEPSADSPWSGSPWTELPAEPAPGLDADTAAPADPFVETSWVAWQPPPAPDEVPEQLGWTPAPAAPEQVAEEEVEPAIAASAFAEPVPAEPVPAEPASIEPEPAEPAPVEPAFEPARAETPRTEEQPPGPNRVGGLTRRVPGASLADRERTLVASGAAPVTERSATGVRSMLSSFQDGRSRGRKADPGEAPATPDTGSRPEHTPADHDVPTDWRSTK